MVDDRDMPGRRFPDMWVDPEDDPREGGPSLGDERTTLIEFLRTQRLNCFSLAMRLDCLRFDLLVPGIGLLACEIRRGYEFAVKHQILCG